MQAPRLCVQCRLTRCAAMDLAPSGIRVNSVSPAWTWTREVSKAAGAMLETAARLWSIAQGLLHVSLLASQVATGSTSSLSGAVIICCAGLLTLLKSQV